MGHQTLTNVERGEGCGHTMRPPRYPTCSLFALHQRGSNTLGEKKLAIKEEEEIAGHKIYLKNIWWNGYKLITGEGDGCVASSMLQTFCCGLRANEVYCRKARVYCWILLLFFCFFTDFSDLRTRLPSSQWFCLLSLFKIKPNLKNQIQSNFVISNI